MKKKLTATQILKEIENSKGTEKSSERFNISITVFEERNGAQKIAMMFTPFNNAEVKEIEILFALLEVQKTYASGAAKKYAVKK